MSVLRTSARAGLVLAAGLTIAGCTEPAGDDSAPDDTAGLGPADPAFLTVFLDGPAAAGSSFWNTQEGQPAVRYVVEEPDGSLTHFFLDVGDDSAAFEYDLDVDTSIADLPPAEAGVDFVLVSHVHALLDLGGSGDAGGIRRLLELDPDLTIYLPDPGGLTYDLMDPTWEEIGLLERAVLLPEGYTQLTPRVGVYGTRFQEAEPDVIAVLGQAELQENLLLIDSGAGYHVHSVCGHLPVETLEGRVVHPIELLQAQLGDTVPAGEITSVLTGGCDLERIGQAAGLSDHEASDYAFESLRDHLTGLARFGVAHCGLPLEPLCREVFGDACVVGLPGTVLELAP